MPRRTKTIHERDIQSLILDRLRLLGGIWYKIEKATPDGCPDIVGWYNGKSYAIELKVPGKKPDPNQTIAIRKIAEHGVSSVKVDAFDNAQDVFDFVRS